MEKNTMIIAVVAVVAVVAVAGVAIIMMGDGNDDAGFDHEGKWVEQGAGAAGKLAIEEDELNGWTSGEGTSIKDNEYIIYFKNDDGLIAYISLEILESPDAAKEKYAEYKGYDEANNGILSFEKCEQSHKYDYGQYIRYMLQDLNVYAYFEIQGEVNEQDRDALADKIASLLTEKIHAAAIAIA